MSGPTIRTIDFITFPNSVDVWVTMYGPAGTTNPVQFRAPADGSYLNLLRLSLGDLSTFTLDQNHPFTTSGAVLNDEAAAWRAREVGSHYGDVVAKEVVHLECPRVEPQVAVGLHEPA